MKKSTSLGAAAAVVAALAGAPAAQADSFTVYVGYADNLRPSGFFPTGWIGTPGAVSESSAAQSFDSGAIRIDNTGASAITISNLTVTYDGGAVVWNFWNPLTISPGQRGIFTQTYSYNFDSSDQGFLPFTGVDAGHPLGGCTNPGAYGSYLVTYCNTPGAGIPIVSFNENGNAQSLNDSGWVLNTFGYDFVNGSSDGNESINWNVIGSTTNRGGNGNGVPEPATLGLIAFGLAGVGFARRRKS